MANTKISQLPQNNNPTGSEELVYALNNANGKMTLNTMKTFATTGLQPELVSWTNIKTINWNDILWSWNIVISWGGWGWSTWTISLNAAENIAAWTLVSFDSTWVKKLRRWFYGTADTWISLTVAQNQYTMIDSVAVTSDTTVVLYTDWDDDWYVVAIKWDGETRNVWTPVKISADVRFPRISSPYTWEFVVAYWDYTWSWAVSVIAWSISWTTITLWTKVQLLWAAPAQWWVWITRRSDADAREFVTFYVKDSDKKIYYQICTYNSSLVITWWTEATYFSSTTESWMLWVDYLWWWAVWVIYDCVSGWTHYVYAGYSNAWASTISSSARIALFTWTTTWNIWFTPRSVMVTKNIFLVDPWTDTTWLCLVWTYWLGRALYIIESLEYNNSPVTWRSYCTEDLDKWIIWMFGIEQIQWNYTIVYSRYKWTDVWLEKLSEIVYWAWDFYSQQVVTRLWNTSSCTLLDNTNSRITNVLFQDESDIFLWINDSAATSWSPVDVTYSWVATTAWLTAWLPMYIWLDWAISQTWADGWRQIWIATGSTDALLK